MDSYKRKTFYCRIRAIPQEGGGLRFFAGYPNFQAITEYNHSNKYAMAVSEMAEMFKN